MQHNRPCIKCGLEDEPEWIYIIQSLLQTDNHWPLLQYMIQLVKRIHQRSNKLHTACYECYDTDAVD